VAIRAVQHGQWCPLGLEVETTPPPGPAGGASLRCPGRAAPGGTRAGPPNRIVISVTRHAPARTNAAPRQP
jgi:hypothetical protein